MPTSYDPPHCLHWLDAFHPAGGLCRPAGGPGTGRRQAGPIPVPTLGGKQFWADELFFHQWRIQRNVYRHCRLLDEHNLRHASGTYDHAARPWSRSSAAPPAAHERQGRRRPARAGAVAIVDGLALPVSPREGRLRGLQRRDIRARKTTWPSTPARSATSSTTSTASRRSISSATAWATS